MKSKNSMLGGTQLKIIIKRAFGLGFSGCKRKRINGE